MATMTSPVVSETDFASIVKAYTDVTERLKRSHDALAHEVCRLREELHEKNKELLRRERLAALGEMAAGVAHEIRNPLGGIRLYASLLDRDLVDMPKQQEIVRKMSAGIANLDAIVGDILAFAGEPGAAGFSPRGPCRKSVPLSTILEGALAQTAAKAEASRISVQIDPALTELELFCDPGQIERALINLMLNAFEAIADGRARGQNGRVWIRRGTDLASQFAGPVGQIDDGPPHVEPTWPASLLVQSVSSMCRIVVEDNGPGVPPEIVHRVFDPFFTTRDSGIGLGLAIVHRIADANCGSISVANGTGNGLVRGGGAAFVLSVPLSEKRSKRTCPRREQVGPAVRTTSAHKANKGKRTRPLVRACVAAGEDG